MLDLAPPVLGWPSTLCYNNKVDSAAKKQQKLFETRLVVYDTIAAQKQCDTSVAILNYIYLLFESLGLFFVLTPLLSFGCCLFFFAVTFFEIGDFLRVVGSEALEIESSAYNHNKSAWLTKGLYKTISTATNIHTDD